MAQFVDQTINNANLAANGVISLTQEPIVLAAMLLSLVVTRSPSITVNLIEALTSPLARVKWLAFLKAAVVENTAMISAVLVLLPVPLSAPKRYANFCWFAIVAYAGMFVDVKFTHAITAVVAVRLYSRLRSQTFKVLLIGLLVFTLAVENDIGNNTRASNNSTSSLNTRDAQRCIDLCEAGPGVSTGCQLCCQNPWMVTCRSNSTNPLLTTEPYDSWCANACTEAMLPACADCCKNPNPSYPDCMAVMA
jgi:hypothetical protein